MSTQPKKANRRKAKKSKSDKQEPSNGKGRYQNKKERANQKMARANGLLKELGGHGTDSRSDLTTPDSVKANLLVPTEDPSIDVEPSIDQRSLAHLALGIILRAIKKGWQNRNSPRVNASFYAFVYLTETFKLVVQGTFPSMQQAPLWFWEICHALRPKTVRFKTGSITYSGQVVPSLGEVTPPQLFPLQVGADAYYIFWGNPGGVKANGFPILLPAVPYNDDLGKASIGELWDVFTGDGLCKLTADPGGDNADLSQDTSAFGPVYSELGHSFQSPGGMALTAYSERFITCPMLAKFCGYQDSDVWRGFQEYHKSAGSACYILPRMSELPNIEGVKNKISPVVKFYNFDEFAEVLILTMCKARENFGTNAGNVAIGPYPLTSQQFQILLRQALIPYFSNEIAQDLRYNNATDGHVLSMYPFVVGPNGASFTSVSSGMRVPRFFAETVRAAMRSTSVLKSSFGKQLSPDRSCFDAIPILGRPAFIDQLSQYTYSAGDGVNVNFFADPGIEMPMSLIDCSITTGSSVVFVDLNGPEMTAYIDLHNAWMTSFSSYFTALTDLSAVEKGISALKTTLLTSHQRFIFAVPTVAPAPSAASSKGLHKTSSVKDMGLSLPKRRVGAGPAPGTSSEYFRLNIGVVKATATLPQPTACWKYSSLMVKPVFLAYDGFASGSILQYQTEQVEPYTIAISTIDPVNVLTNLSNTSVPSLYDFHLAAANLDCRVLASEALSEMELDMNKLQEGGRGGFFTMLGNVLGGLVDSF